MAHYTDSPEISALMASRLELSGNELVWEPCAGRGHLVDAVLARNPLALIHLSEGQCQHADFLRAKYRNATNIRVRCEDPLRESVFGARRPDAAIANPPFGAWRSIDERSALKRRYPDLYVRESYVLFIQACLQAVRSGGTMVFIIPDSFLWLHRHTAFRRRLLKTVEWREVILLPSKLLPSAAFGYADLAIITICNQHPRDTSQIRLVRCQTARELNEHTRNGLRSRADEHVRQRDVLAAEESAFGTGNSTSARRAVVLGDIADVRTGFYSGNDRRWRYRRSSNVPRSKGYRDVDPDMIFTGKLAESAITSGITGPRHFVPMMRGGAAAWIKPTDWYVDWSTEAVAEYKRPGKNSARFQNATFYFRQGIGVPMVASRNLTAALIDHRLIDQSIVGIFPHDERLLLPLLAFLNSPEASEQMASINPTANNSAGYIRRLRVPILNKSECAETIKLTERLLSLARCGREFQTLEEKIFKLLRSSNDAVSDPIATYQRQGQLQLL